MMPELPEAIAMQLAELALSETARKAYQQMLHRLGQQLLVLPSPQVIGISGAQGTGKSTLARLLAGLLNANGIKAAAVSLDDYYLSRAARHRLAADIHPLLAQRGVPGTHHIQQAIADARAVLQGQPVSLPQFDKAQDEPVAALPAQQYQVLLVEGWCLGIAAQSDTELRQPLNPLERQQDPEGYWRHYVNRQLAGPYAAYWQLLHPLIWLKAPDWQAVCRWRANQEQVLWQQCGSGMSDAELARFMLSFQRLTEAGWQQLPQRADYIITLDQQQQPLLPVNG
ncbi:kinase [Chromatiaceae bacterium AAb-1]|nr:kinase [Chromatiaceae bacterium AAb-1]